MKTLYLDIFSGISGDMFIGALIDLGVDAREIERELARLKLDEFHIHVSRQARGAIAGTKFDVHLSHDHEHEHEHRHGKAVHSHAHSHAHAHEHGHEDDSTAHHATSHGADHHHGHLHGHTHGPHGGLLVQTSQGRVELSVFETNVPPRFRLYFFDQHGHEVAPLPERNVTVETIRGKGKRQTFTFQRKGRFLEARRMLPEPHEFEAVLSLKHGRKSERRRAQFVEDHDPDHDHDHGHGKAHRHADGHNHDGHGRTFAEIRRLIEQSSLSPWVKEKAVAVFHRVALAEGKIHGHPPEKVHFHEVGAVDSIVDIVGACIALDLLGRPRVLSGHPIEGTGSIRCAHGTFPIPAPATWEILAARGASIRQCEEPAELITPTGAAILAEFVEAFGPVQDLVAEKIGYGLGTRENRTRPNVLRAVLGHAGAATAGAASSLDWETDSVAVLETNLDDMTPELLGAFVEKAFAGGALDVFQTAVQMKKNRPGTVLTVLCAAAEADRFSELILRETTAFGVRRTVAERRKLRRQTRTVKTPFGAVEVKLGLLNGKVIQASPEFESCRRLAQRAGVPIRAIYEAATKGVEV